MSNLVYGWEVRRWRAFYERLARSFRLILFDKRGTGFSDHGPHYAGSKYEWRTYGRCSTEPNQARRWSWELMKAAGWPRSSQPPIRDLHDDVGRQLESLVAESRAAAEVTQGSASSTELAADLERLGSLHERGLLTDEEFAEAKARAFAKEQQPPAAASMNTPA